MSGRRSLLRTLRRLHIWAGWLIGVPLLLWTATGLWMVARPIEEVRGSASRRDPPPLMIPPGSAPPTLSRPVRSLALEQRPHGAVWVARFVDGEIARADARGRWLPPLSRAEAEAIARATYLAPSTIARATLTSADAPPLELRQHRPAWGIRFTDGTNLYVDADSGAVLALRTRQWRAFDLMWGLHIMDLKGRDDTSHPVLIGAAALSFVSVLIGLVLLPLVGRFRGR
jgi:hypothetical protein